MIEFLASKTGLILGFFLLAMAAADYIVLRYFWHKFNPRNDEQINSIRHFGAYWITGCVVGGLFLIIGYVRYS